LAATKIENGSTSSGVISLAGSPSQRTAGTKAA
jgi:hypothetical protein